MKKPRLGQVRCRGRKPGDGHDNRRYQTHVIECYYDGAWQYVGPAGPSAPDRRNSANALRRCVDGVLGDSIDAVIAEATT